MDKTVSPDEGPVLAQHEVGHPVHAALHGAGHRPKEVLDALASAGFAVVEHARHAPVQEYPKRIDCDDGVERIVHSKEEEHKHKKPKDVKVEGEHERKELGKPPGLVQKPPSGLSAAGKP
jgi:hypothetical protein